MTDNVHAIKTDDPPMIGRFVETETASKILTALRRARAKSKMTMIAGAPGVGKSEVLRKFKLENKDVIYFSATAGEGGIWNLANGLCQILDIDPANSRDLPGTRERIADAVGVDGFVLVDEAQYLVQRNLRGPDNWEVIEWLRGALEEGYFGAAVCGDLKLLNALNDAPQLRRRTHPRVTITHTSERDVTIYCNACGFDDEKTVALLARVAKRYGGIGDIAEILTTATAMCNGGVPSPSDVRAALQFLDFPMGGR